jgi:hypothetical protein
MFRALTIYQAVVGEQSDLVPLALRGLEVTAAAARVTQLLLAQMELLIQVAALVVDKLLAAALVAQVL